MYLIEYCESQMVIPFVGSDQQNLYTLLPVRSQILTIFVPWLRLSLILVLSLHQPCLNLIDQFKIETLQGVYGP